MIPALGYMIGAYIVFRAFEMWSKPAVAFDCAGSKRAMRLLAVVVVAVAALMMYEISQASDMIPRLPR